jgi:hypothetical protein
MRVLSQAIERMGYGNNIFCLVGDWVEQIAKVKE